MTAVLIHLPLPWGSKRLVGWEINVPFQHNNRLYRGQSWVEI